MNLVNSNWIFKISLILWIALRFQLTNAQEKTDSARYLVKTNDRKEFIAKILFKTDSTISFRIENNLGKSDVVIDRKSVLEIKKINSGEIVNGKYWRPPSNISYFLTPSGYGLRKGEWNIQNVWVLYNQVNVGVTNGIQVGVGTLPFAGMLWANVRATAPIVKDKLLVGGTFIYGTYSFNNIFFQKQSKWSMGYGFATVGSKNYNVTLGYGAIMSEGSIGTFFTVNGAFRLSRSLLLVTENYILPNNLHMIGLKIDQNKITLSCGVLLFKDYRTQAIPWLGIAFRFGKNTHLIKSGNTLYPTK